TDWLTRRSKQADNLISGTPVIVLQSGEPLMERLAEERLTMDELKEAARIHGFGDLEQVEWAILETDGQFSFIGKASPQ
ncbi:MAG TPA: YetF domain-containing protein, partial [Acidimicrobiia bacterium]|nr:YetF domain-containing protein [Acidimicrobiia bacterium]